MNSCATVQALLLQRWQVCLSFIIFLLLSKVIKSAFGYSWHIKGNNQIAGLQAKKSKSDILTWETEPQEMCRAHISVSKRVCPTQLSHRCLKVFFFFFRIKVCWMPEFTLQKYLVSTFCNLSGSLCALCVPESW